MKKNLFALALALTLVGTLAACGTDRSSNSSNPGASGAASGSGASAGQVTRRYDSPVNGSRSYLDDGHYSAGANGHVYDASGGAVSRDLTQDARDIVRDTGDAIGDIGRDLGSAAQDITGTPSWEPDSSAVRY